jgi:hypothetical protein
MKCHNIYLYAHGIPSLILSPKHVASLMGAFLVYIISCYYHYFVSTGILKDLRRWQSYLKLQKLL